MNQKHMLSKKMEQKNCKQNTYYCIGPKGATGPTGPTGDLTYGDFIFNIEGNNGTAQMAVGDDLKLRSNTLDITGATSANNIITAKNPAIILNVFLFIFHLIILLI